MSELLSKIVNDKDFNDSVQDKLNSIMSDGKIDAMDIPDITLLVVECATNLKKFRVTENELPGLLIDILNYIFDKYEIIPDDQEEKFKNMMETVIKLVLLKPRVKKCIRKMLDNLRCTK
uniref:Uncharacterized protein n=1 Tax=Megaviridae environmental sample TaxID=1737588 RepID=A0A5J6VK83_9VIRU|nr:MAG: hypothetical protein [Megaviridae environmental sample]